MSFLPPGIVATFAHSATLGGRSALKRGRKRGKKRAKRARAAAPARARKGKPKPGTKAWMAYIRGKRGKKK